MMKRVKYKNEAVYKPVNENEPVKQPHVFRTNFRHLVVEEVAVAAADCSFRHRYQRLL